MNSTKERPILFSAPMVRAILDGRKTQTRRVVDLDNLHGFLPRTVRGDWIFADVVAQPGKHKLHTNRNFAVSAVLKDKHLGLKPGEFNFLTPYAGECRADVVDGKWHLDPLEKSHLWVRESFSFHETPKDPYFLPPGTPGEALGIHYWADGNPEWGNWGKPKPSIHMPRRASRITLEVTGVRVERLQDISGRGLKAEGIDQVRQEWSRHPDFCETLSDRELFEVLWESLNGKGSWNANPWVWVVEFEKAEA